MADFCGAVQERGVIDLRRGEPSTTNGDGEDQSMTMAVAPLLTKIANLLEDMKKLLRILGEAEDTQGVVPNHGDGSSSSDSPGPRRGHRHR